MADEPKTEMFMMITDESGNPIYAQCQTQLDSQDDLVQDFARGTYFQVDDFKFGMNIDDKDPASNKEVNQASPLVATRTGSSIEKSSALGDTKVVSAGSGPKFGKWKSATDDDVKKMKYPVKMDEVTITRRYDRASPVLFEKCALSETLTTAVLVKRKVIGNSTLQTFFRIDFTNVLITKIDLEDEATIKETLHIIFRDIVVSYRKQLHDGTLGPAGSANWNYELSTKV
jgi:type VI secretion system Hcp family effector